MGDHRGKFNYFTIVGHYHICLSVPTSLLAYQRPEGQNGINHCVSNGFTLTRALPFVHVHMHGSSSATMHWSSSRYGNVSLYMLVS